MLLLLLLVCLPSIYRLSPALPCRGAHSLAPATPFRLSPGCTRVADVRSGGDATTGISKHDFHWTTTGGGAADSSAVPCLSDALQGRGTAKRKRETEKEDTE